MGTGLRIGNILPMGWGVKAPRRLQDRLGPDPLLKPRASQPNVAHGKWNIFFAPEDEVNGIPLH